MHFFLFHLAKVLNSLSSLTVGARAQELSRWEHIVANGGDTQNLFRAAFMESGSPSPNGDITDGQPQYDALVSATNCTGASDTLSCLRAAPFDAIKAAMDASPSIASYEVFIS